MHFLGIYHSNANGAQAKGMEKEKVYETKYNSHSAPKILLLQQMQDLKNKTGKPLYGILYYNESK